MKRGRKPARDTRGKSLGQNFLTDEDILQSIVTSANITPQDTVFEVGAGMGDLSAILAQKCAQLVTVEVDDHILPFARLRLESFDNVRVIHGDIRRLHLAEILEPLGPFKIVANLPYYLTTELIEMFMLLPQPVKSVSVMVQKEAGQRVLAGPGEEGYGPLSILCQVKATPQTALDVPARYFNPPPKVDSMFLHMPVRSTPPVPQEEQTIFLQTVRAAFSQRRKPLLNTVMPFFRLERGAAEAVLKACGRPLNVRAEEMQISQFLDLSGILQSQ